MKSWRLKSVALTWLHGGHHFAPQYMKTGLCSSRAAANAASTWASLAASCQAMPATSPCDAVVVAAAAVAGARSVGAVGDVDVGAAVDVVAADCGRSQAATNAVSAHAAARTATRG